MEVVASSSPSPMRNQLRSRAAKSNPSPMKNLCHPLGTLNLRIDMNWLEHVVM